jgi:heat shock protein beta
MLAKKQLEINPAHPIMKKMLSSLKESDDNVLNEAETEYADLLFNMALLNSGFLLDDPSSLTEPLERLIKVGFGFAREAECSDINVEISESEPEDEEDEVDVDARKFEAMEGAFAEAGATLTGVKTTVH